MKSISAWLNNYCTLQHFFVDKYMKKALKIAHFSGKKVIFAIPLNTYFRCLGIFFID
jgi:hypothetical protein